MKEWEDALAALAGGGSVVIGYTGDNAEVVAMFNKFYGDHVNDSGVRLSINQGKKEVYISVAHGVTPEPVPAPAPEPEVVVDEPTDLEEDNDQEDYI